ncbi:MAG: hypothetical protein R3D30_05620 [Hyphomicrobiales bacterium]
MRRFLLIAAAASIALIGLSANSCGGGDEDKASEAAPAAPAEEMPAKPDDSMSDDSMMDESNTDPNDQTVDEIPADE